MVAAEYGKVNILLVRESSSSIMGRGQTPSNDKAFAIKFNDLDIKMTLREKIEKSLKPNEYIFDSVTMPIFSLVEMESKNLYPVCGRCGSRLEYALNPQEAKRKGVPPGVRCPKNLNHCQITVEFPRGE